MPSSDGEGLTFDLDALLAQPASTIYDVSVLGADGIVVWWCMASQWNLRRTLQRAQDHQQGYRGGTTAIDAPTAPAQIVVRERSPMA